MSNLAQRAALCGRNAAIIGGAAGIGEAVTLALAAEGVNVAICDIAEGALGPTAEKVIARGARAVTSVADAADAVELGRFYDIVETEYDHIDILVNLAGCTLQRSFAETDSLADNLGIRRNFGYVLDSTRRAIPLIRKSGRGGSVINFTTIEAHRGAATFAVYAGAKAAMRNFTAALAVELDAERIRVNCIAPDTTPSAGNRNTVPTSVERMALLPPHMQGAAIPIYVPMKVAPAPEDLADAVLYLASDLSRFVTGNTVHVDGGTKAASGFLTGLLAMAFSLRQRQEH